MIARSLLFAASLALLPAAASANPMFKNSGSDAPKNGQEEWLQRYDFYVPYGTGGLDPGRGYPKPYYPGMRATLTCAEAEWLLRQKGYRSIKPLDCSGDAYRFEGSRIGATYILHIDRRKGDVIRRDRL